MIINIRVTKAMIELARRAGDRDLAKLKFAQEQAALTSMQMRLNTINGVQTEFSASAWCADYTDDIANNTDVGLIEIPGEGRDNVIIQPGYQENSNYDPERDGALFPRLAQSAEQVFFNAAMLPGWQRFQPTYRTGIMTAVDMISDTANVSLDSARSSAMNLDINQSVELQGIPVRYMSCNAAAFEVGDHVLVRFENQRWDSPEVIGFTRDPRPCDADLYVSAYSSLLGGVVSYATGYVRPNYSEQDLIPYGSQWGVAPGISDTSGTASLNSVECRLMFFAGQHISSTMSVPGPDLRAMRAYGLGSFLRPFESAEFGIVSRNHFRVAVTAATRNLTDLNPGNGIYLYDAANVTQGEHIAFIATPTRDFCRTGAVLESHTNGFLAMPKPVRINPTGPTQYENWLYSIDNNGAIVSERMLGVTTFEHEVFVIRAFNDKAIVRIRQADSSVFLYEIRDIASWTLLWSITDGRAQIAISRQFFFLMYSGTMESPQSVFKVFSLDTYLLVRQTVGLRGFFPGSSSLQALGVGETANGITPLLLADKALQDLPEDPPAP